MGRKFEKQLEVLNGDTNMPSICDERK